MLGIDVAPKARDETHEHKYKTRHLGLRRFRGACLVFAFVCLIALAAVAANDVDA